MIFLYQLAQAGPHNVLHFLVLENVEHCGGEPELIQKYYVTDEGMSAIPSSKFEYLMFSAS